MGNRCSNPKANTTEEEYRNNIKIDFASRLKELHKTYEVKDVSKTKNDDAQVFKARDGGSHHGGGCGSGES